MNIEWGPNEAHMAELEQQFLAIGKPAISANHYDLERMTGIPANQWRIFLSDARVSTWVEQEFKIIKNAELKKTVTDINSSRSVGQAQIITTLNKMTEEADTRNEGPAFIYCYTPLNNQQQTAENILQIGRDVFAQS